MLYFITGNKGKFQEAQKILGRNLKQLEVDLDEIQELDPKVIIAKKLKEARKHKKGEFIVDDVSFYFGCFDYSFPGPLIKWMLHSLQPEGLYQLAKKYHNFDAKIELNLGYINEKGEVKFFSAKLAGKVVPPKGKNGFGWDPIFRPEGTNKTYAELNAKEAREIKVRYKVFRKLRNFLKKNGKI